MRESKFVEFDSALHPSIRTFLERCPANMSPLQHVGYTFEVVVALALAKAGIQRILTNPLHDIEQWTRQQGLGVDIVLPDEEILIEVKNNDGTYFLTPAMIEHDTLSRFRLTDPKHMKKWMVVFAHNTLSPGARRLLAEHNVIVAVAGRTATKRHMPGIVRTLARKLRKALYLDTIFTQKTAHGVLDTIEDGVFDVDGALNELIASYVAHHLALFEPRVAPSTPSEVDPSIRHVEDIDVVVDLVEEAHFAAVDRWLFIPPFAYVREEEDDD